MLTGDHSFGVTSFWQIERPGLLGALVRTSGCM